MPRFGYVVGLACAAVLALPAGAVATHNGDSHSQNMRVDWSYRLGLSPSSTHSDVAIWKNIVVSGNYNGFRVFDTSRKGDRLVRGYQCRGPQNDVSLWGYQQGDVERLLLFMSIDTPQLNGDTVCGVSGTDCSVSNPSCWEGIRIFDLTDPANPVYVKGVRTNCGSHTHTLIPDEANNRVLIYATTASTSGGPYCQIPHNRIPIIAVPLDAPVNASVIAEPRIMPSTLRGCHDITVFLALKKAAAACESEGQLWDLIDPANPGMANPVRLDHSSVNYWHSAEFTWDGQYVVFDDETFVNHGCLSTTPTGRIWIYRVSDGQLMTPNGFMTPRYQGSGVYCGSHNGNIVPVDGRYILVMSWYAGGTSVIDFTNPSAPIEIAHYDATTGGAADTWSSYWYNGKIYANDIVRGLDVFRLDAPFTSAAGTWDHLNAQTQEEFYPPPMASLTALARLTQPPLAGPSGPARVALRKGATARERGSLSRVLG
jgi:hypothetical protein